MRGSTLLPSAGQPGLQVVDLLLTQPLPFHVGACMCVGTCASVHGCACVGVHLHVCVHVCMCGVHACVCKCACVGMHVHACVCVHVGVRACVCKCACMHGCACVGVHRCAHVCMHMCVHARVCVCVHVPETQVRLLFSPLVIVSVLESQFRVSATSAGVPAQFLLLLLAPSKQAYK